MDQVPSATRRQRKSLLLVLSYIGFISLGLPDTVTGIAWPAVRETFALPQSGLGWISVAFGTGYFLSSFFSGKLTHALGIGTLLAMSTLLVALALFGNSLSPAWLMFVGCGALWGLGSGAIDAGLNTYAARHFSARHINWLHACYSLGATIGPLLMTASLVQAGSWRLGYSLVGGIVFALGIAFLLTARQWSDRSAPVSEAAQRPATMRQALRQTFVWLHVVLFFLYTGLEFLIGHWCFTLLTESRGFSAEAAGLITSSYFGAILCGRIVLGAIVDRFGVDRLVRLSLAASLVGAVLFAAAPSPVLSIVGLAILGLGLAPVFPCLMSRTPARLGERIAAYAVGFQVSAATIGAALLPALGGVLAERISLESIAILAAFLALVLVILHELLLRFPTARALPVNGRRC
jgi:fucose permease